MDNSTRCIDAILLSFALLICGLGLWAVMEMMQHPIAVEWFGVSLTAALILFGFVMTVNEIIKWWFKK